MTAKRFLARAQARATFHRFTDALTDLDEAQRLGAEPTVVDAERAAVFQAIGRYDDALTIYREAAERRADFHSIGALAVLHAERGEVDAAERLFRREPGSLPGGLAVSAGAARLPARTDVDDAGRSSTAPVSGSVRPIAACQPTLPRRAIWPRSRPPWASPRPQSRRLLPLTISSDDPDYPAQLARILNEVDRLQEGREWRARAAARYDELLARHPDAFADHAAEFWLEAGADPHRALALARRNLEVRQTPRAHELLARATRANEAPSRGSLNASNANLKNLRRLPMTMDEVMDALKI